MKRTWIVTSIVVLSGCGPSYGGQDVKTSDEWIAEQEKIAAEDEKRKKERGDEFYTDEETDEEKRKKFDRTQAERELKRATRSAESCPGVVAEQETKENKQRGTTNVTITFQEDGSVKDVSIGSPFSDTPVGNCVLNAYKAVLVPPFVGGDQVIDWEVTLEDKKEEKAAKKK